ncbi:RNA-binding S4 domain-containing protein [Nitrosomonas sp. HPC101]|uniref:RNA-binding S4 domain-containing protein n=1 Tax=Nitrosomonas sp. HPC101 TaxID=1658667 RepID=UPI00136E8510|nr:RNA-binding S4 domain-containing protein [Nitrosomonas sp. HPC101]MXS86373.1 RNA-binding S4 domain-containing protein [Nitrosomonas sp. HPC101]
MTEKGMQATGEKFRIDKWLFAARFYKTRSQAADAVERGQVQINGMRAKPSRILTAGDMLEIRIGPYHHLVKVLALSNQRRPATEARLLYQETEESRLARAVLAENIKSQPAPHYAGKGRPTKRTRRDLDRFMSEK